MFSGVYTALVTPFNKDNSIDFATLSRLIDIQLKNKVEGLIILGTTAETSCLEDAEKKSIVEFAKDKIANKCKLIIGVGGNCTAKTVKKAKEYLTYKPDAFLVVTPYYNKPNRTGLIEHYRQIAALGVAIVLYHIPGRTGQKLSVDLIEELVDKIPEIKAIKEADADSTHIVELCTRLSEKVDILSGNDDMFLQLLSLNAKGIISAAANVMPNVFIKLYQERNPHYFAKAYPLIKACYYEVNPTCAKYMLEKLGYGSALTRLPLGPVDDKNKKLIDTLLSGYTKEFLFGE